MVKERRTNEYLLPWRVRAAMVWRSLFIQATNNFERMLALGFLFALWPALRRAYPEPEARRDAVVRHLAFFNTHPYLANSILGVVAHAELTHDGPSRDEEVRNLKRAMMGALGALGDDLFWAGLMPAAALVALTVFAYRPAWALLGVIAALVLYNIGHLWTRVRLFELSLRYGRRITRVFKLLRLPRVVVAVKLAGAFLLGVFAVTAAAGGGGADARSWAMAAAFGGAVVGALLLQRLGVRPGWCWLAVTAAATAGGALVR